MYFDHTSITAPNPEIFSIFGFGIRWYGLLIAIGISLAVMASLREGKKRGIDSDTIIDLILWGIPLSVLGTRVYFLLFNNFWGFMQNPFIIFRFRDGGLAIHGGIITAGTYAYFALKKRKIYLWPFLDIVAVGFFIGQIIGRFGNFMNQEAYGRIINAPTLDAQRAFLTNLHIPEFIVNGMFIRGNYHHPTFLYESLWNIAGLLIIILVLRRLKFILVGEIAAFYALWYSFGRFFIESLRTDSLMIGPLRTAQVISIITIVVVLTAVIMRRVKQKEMVYYTAFNLPKWQEETFGKMKKKTKKAS